MPPKLHDLWNLAENTNHHSRRNLATLFTAKNGSFFTACQKKEAKSGPGEKAIFHDVADLR